MSVVRTLTKEGMTIVATIHSPTPYCFNLFDRLMILIGGHAIYHGPNGNVRLPPPPQKVILLTESRFSDISRFVYAK